MLSLSRSAKENDSFKSPQLLMMNHGNKTFDTPEIAHIDRASPYYKLPCF